MSRVSKGYGARSVPRPCSCPHRSPAARGGRPRPSLRSPASRRPATMQQREPSCGVGFGRNEKGTERDDDREMWRRERARKGGRECVVRFALFVPLADGGWQLEIQVVEPNGRVPAPARLRHRGTVLLERVRWPLSGRPVLTHGAHCGASGWFGKLARCCPSGLNEVHRIASECPVMGGRKRRLGPYGTDAASNAS